MGSRRHRDTATPRRATRQRRAEHASPPPAPQSLRRQALWISLALVALGVLVYAPVAGHEFVNWDDPEYVSDNPVVAQGLTWAGVIWAFASAHSANWHPLTWLSHMLDVQLFGVHPGLHHVTNVVMHLGNAVLLFTWLRETTGAPSRSAVVAALFTVHPLHVESVAWVAERKDVLSTLFWMLALWAYTLYVRRPSLGRYCLVFASVALGLIAKPMVITLPFVFLLLDVWPLHRVEFREFGQKERAVWLRLVGEKIPLFALSLASAVVTFIAQSQGGAVVQLERFPFRLRVANALMSYVAYIRDMFWPARLSVVYPPRAALEVWAIPAAAVLLFAISLIAVLWARKRSYLLVGWLWYLGTLVPVIGIVQVGSQPMADRYTYVPLIGLFIILAWGVPDLLARWQVARLACPVATAVAIVACACIARVQVGYWHDNVTLWTHALEATGANPRAHNNLANALLDQQRWADAFVHYQEAVRLKPNFGEAHSNLANALMHDGRIDEASREYREALRLNQNDAFAHNGLGSALDEQGKFAEAIAHYREAIRIAPEMAEAHNNLGAALGKEGRIDEAIREFLEAVRAKPRQADFHYNLAVMFGQKGNTGEARRQLEQALAIRPDYLPARRGLEALAPVSGADAARSTSRPPD